MTRRKRGVVLGAAALAALGGGTALAVGAGGGGPAADQQAFIGDVASRLGVTPDKLQQAITGAFDDRLDAAVSAGTLTQAQADAIKARQQAKGGLPPLGAVFGFGGAHHGMRFGAGPFGLLRPDVIDAATSYLGLTGDQLRTQLRSGKTLAEIATAQGKTADGLKAALIAAITTDLNDAVGAGKLTRSQADHILSATTDRLDDVIAGTARIGPRGGTVFFGRGGGFGPGPFGILKPDTLSAAADYLGLSAGELRDDLGSAKSLADLATAQGKTADGLKAAMTAAIKKDLDAAVAAGKLTQSKENDVLSSIQQRLDDMISGRPAFGRGWRRGPMPAP